MWGRSGDGLSTHCSETSKSVRIRTRVGLNSRFCRELRCAPIPLRDLGGLLDSLRQLLNQLYVRSIQPPDTKFLQRAGPSRPFWASNIASKSRASPALTGAAPLTSHGVVEHLPSRI